MKGAGDSVVRGTVRVDLTTFCRMECSPDIHSCYVIQYVYFDAEAMYNGISTTGICYIYISVDQYS